MGINKNKIILISAGIFAVIIIGLSIWISILQSQKNDLKKQIIKNEIEVVQIEMTAKKAAVSSILDSLRSIASDAKIKAAETRSSIPAPKEIPVTTYDEQIEYLKKLSR